MFFTYKSVQALMSLKILIIGSGGREHAIAWLISKSKRQVDKIYVEEGETVKKGKILASINSDIIKSNIEEIESSLNLLKTIYDRQSNLWKEEIGSEIEYLRSKTNYESAKNRYNALKIQASKFSITAPFSGIIESVNTKVGEVSSPGMPAFRMFNDSDSYISVDVPENYLNLC